MSKKLVAGVLGLCLPVFLLAGAGASAQTASPLSRDAGRQQAKQTCLPTGVCLDGAGRPFAVCGVAMLAAHGKGPVEPWSDKDAIPPPLGGCDDEMVPPFIPRFEDPKTGNPIDLPFLQMRVDEQHVGVRLADPREQGLEVLGVELERVVEDDVDCGAAQGRAGHGLRGERARGGRDSVVAQGRLPRRVRSKHLA